MSLVKNIGGFLQEWAVNTSQAPADWQRAADKASQELTREFQSFEEQNRQASQQIEQNLRGSEGARFGSMAGRWLSKPVNLIGSLIFVIGIIWAVKAGKL